MTSPNVLACEELERIDTPQPAIAVRSVENLNRLRQLWEIDNDAYGNCSIPFDSFRKWWELYELGSTNLLCDNQILASYGLWPLPEDMAIAFANGEISESELLPVSLTECERQPQRYWYASGVVILEPLRGLKTNPLSHLLRTGLSYWLSSGHVAYPLSVLALAEYQAGQNMLSRMGFVEEQSGDELPDGCPLYQIRASSEEEIRSLLRARGL